MSELDNSIEITLKGEPFKLVPTLKAAMAVSRQFNGFVNAYGVMGAGNLEVVCFIIETGTDNRRPDRTKISTVDLQMLVWQTGITNLTKACLEYINLLENGGERPKEPVAKKDDEEGDVTGNE